MKKISFLAVIAILFITSSAAQNPKRTVLYKLAPGEHMRYDEYIVDFNSPINNYMFVVGNTTDMYDPSNYDESYSVVLNGDRRNFHGKRIEYIGLSGWDDIGYTWYSNDGYYVYCDGLYYGPYDGHVYFDSKRKRFFTLRENKVVVVKEGTESVFADRNASMPFFRRENDEYVGRSIHGDAFVAKEEYDYRSGTYGIRMNGIFYPFGSRLYVSDIRVSSDGKHWIGEGGNRKVYVDGNAVEMPIENFSVTRKYINCDGNYILYIYNNDTKEYEFIVNGRRVNIPAGAEIEYPTEHGYNITFADDFAYLYKGDLYVFDGTGFSKKEQETIKAQAPVVSESPTTGKRKNKKKQTVTVPQPSLPYKNTTIYDYWLPTLWNESGAVISGDRRHVMAYGWENPYVEINGKRYGSAPALRAEWNDKTQSFHWSALEGQELVVYEFKP